MKKTILSLALTALIALTASGCTASNTPNSSAKNSQNDSSKKPIIIQGAMDAETQKLVSELKDSEKISYGGWTFWKGKIDDYPVVVSKTEIGMANAAAATTLAIEKFNPKAIINQGTSGGHDPSLHKLDIVIGKKSVNFGAFRSEHADLGKGIKPENWIPMTIEVNTKGEVKEYKDFEGDPDLIKVANSVKDTYKSGKVVEGVIGSADEWNRELDRIKWLNAKYGTSTEEMETASAAQVSKAYDVPFLGIRILSNSEVHNEEYDKTSGDNCQDYVLSVVKQLIKQSK